MCHDRHSGREALRRGASTILLPSLLVRNDNVHDLMFVQGLCHRQPEVLQAHLVARVGVIVRPLQPGTLVLFPFRRHVEAALHRCVCHDLTMSSV